MPTFSLAGAVSGAYPCVAASLARCSLSVVILCHPDCFSQPMGQNASSLTLVEIIETLLRSFVKLVIVEKRHKKLSNFGAVARLEARPWQ